MAYIPKDAEWFLAEHVEEIRVQGRRANVVHVNYVLVKARTPPEAYRKAIDLGKAGNQTYKNSAGRRVTIRFVGLRGLDVIQDSLGHGCEIMYSQKLGVTKSRLRRMVRKKHELEAFLPVRGSVGVPDYASAKVMNEVARRMGIIVKRPGQGNSKRRRRSSS